MQVIVCSISYQIANCLKQIWTLEYTYNCVSSDVFIESFVLNISFYFTLHHSWTIIVFYVAFPPMFNHEAWIVQYIFLESLFPKILYGIIVSICQKVVNAILNRVIF